MMVNYSLMERIFYDDLYTFAKEINCSYKAVCELYLAGFGKDEIKRMSASKARFVSVDDLVKIKAISNLTIKNLQAVIDKLPRHQESKLLANIKHDQKKRSGKSNERV